MSLSMPPPASPPAPRPHDALGRLLERSTSWDTVPVRVSGLITAVSWAFLLLSIGAVAVLGQVGSPLASPSLVGVLLVLPALGLLVTAVATRGFRLASKRGCRWWAVALLGGSLGLAPAVVATVGLVVAVVLAVVLSLLLLALVLAMIG